MAGKFNHSSNGLAYIFFLSVFINGFEAGGYQACMISISKDFGLTDVLIGMIASAQLIAVLIGPIAFGTLADRKGKKSVLIGFLTVRLGACALLFIASNSRWFAVGIFIVGLSISIIQSVSIAGLSDAYPLTGKKKIGILTCMYSLGAVTAPVICGKMLEAGVSWRMMFMAVGIMSIMIIILLSLTDLTKRETVPVTLENGDIHINGLCKPSIIAILCIIMFVYVGVENGFAFFINSFIQDDIGSTKSYLALSMFWLAMIPSRIICGYASRRKGMILLISACAVTAMLLLISFAHNGMTAIFICFALGFFSGAVYPNVLNFAADYSGNNTATATGLITASTGLGGALITSTFGWVSGIYGIRLAFDVLAV